MCMYVPIHLCIQMIFLITFFIYGLVKKSRLQSPVVFHIVYFIFQDDFRSFSKESKHFRVEFFLLH